MFHIFGFKRKPRLRLLGLINLPDYERNLWIEKGKGIPLMPVPPPSDPMGVELTEEEKRLIRENRRQAQAVYNRVQAGGR